MTYFITFLSKDRAQLIESEHRTTDAAIMAMIVKAGEERGYRVVTRTEG